jgi:3-hydroxyisobutyrate dehydrogenase-like beta-hydroxyacid dehydrogenase
MPIDFNTLQHNEIARQIGILGYGERGKAVGAALKLQMGKTIAWLGVWDLQLDEMREMPDHELELADTMRKALRQHARDRGIAATGSVQQLCEMATLVVCCVPPAQALTAAQETAQYIRRGTYYLDLSPHSPQITRAAATCIEAAGGHYVTATTSAPAQVTPHQMPETRLLLSGTHATTLASVLTTLGWSASLANSASSDLDNHSLSSR